jgi:hypothetical protein
MYGVVVIIEFIKFEKDLHKFYENENKEEKEEKTGSKNSKTIVINKKDKVNNKTQTNQMINEEDVLEKSTSILNDINELNISNNKTNIDIDSEKFRDSDLFNKYYYLYGPFLGQVIGSIKDGIKIAYLNGEPRIYESTYLCTFQIEIQHIGKIYSVINKRRGEVNYI